MRADVSRNCTECDCAMLKRRLGCRELLHKYIVGVTTGDGRSRTVPYHLLGEPVLPDGGILLLEMARVFPHPRPESHDGGPETGVRNSSALWGRKNRGNSDDNLIQNLKKRKKRGISGLTLDRK